MKMIYPIGLAVLLVGLEEVRLKIIQLTQAVLNKYILANDTAPQKIHGKNFMGTKYFSEKVFI